MGVCLKRLQFCLGFLVLYLIFQILLLRLLNSFDRDSRSHSVKILYGNLYQKLIENTGVDRSGLYRIIPLKEVTSAYSPNDITLASQCSFNHVHMIKDLCYTWKGPISVAVFAEVENVGKAMTNLAQLLYCNECQSLKLQLVVPVSGNADGGHVPALDIIQDFHTLSSCQSENLGSTTRNYNRSVPYPVNFLRNVAKSGCATEFILVIDIDMIPSVDLHGQSFELYISEESKNSKAVYVVPVFELRENVMAPKTKDDLLEQVKAKKARPFYYVPCRSCQKLTKYDKWLLSNTTSGPRILYEVHWKHPWEPFFIARRDVPDFDVRFKQYGMNRVSQICELHTAGYKFLVLDNVFLTHRGFKTVNEFHASKNAEMEVNRKIYSQFKEELKYKYPNSKRKC